MALTRFNFVRLKQVLVELKEYTVPNEDCQCSEYVDELRIEATELIDNIEKEFSRMNMNLIEKPKTENS